MLRNFPYFKTNKSSEAMDTSPCKVSDKEDPASKAKKLLLASRQIRRSQIRPGVPHQKLFGLLRRTKARHFISHPNKKPVPPKEPTPSTSRQIQTDTEESCENLVRQRKLDSIHKESEELFKECSILKNGSPSSWRQVDVNGKLVYYWTTVSSQCPDPMAFKNFMMYYISRNKRAAKMSHDKIHKKCFDIWSQLRHHEKLPFIAESLISHFSKLPNPTSRRLEHQLKAFFVTSKKAN